MEPCGMNSPHTHPRATEILLLLNGAISAGFLAENGSRFVVNNVTEMSAMVFPAGSIHFQASYSCEPVQFVAALSDEALYKSPSASSGCLPTSSVLRLVVLVYRMSKIWPPW
jgi:hypothetical protein